MSSALSQSHRRSGRVEGRVPHWPTLCQAIWTPALPPFIHVKASKITSQTGLGLAKGLSMRSFHSLFSSSPKKFVPLDSKEGKTGRRGLPTQLSARQAQQGSGAQKPTLCS